MFQVIELHNTECPELLKVNLQGLHLTEISKDFNGFFHHDFCIT
jgi:hypothetical protein